MGALCAGALLNGIQDLYAQSPQGHQVTEAKITVNTQGHWEHWTRPKNVLDITSDGMVRPRSFRRIYDLIEEDRETFRRSIDEPKIKGADKGILNLVRTPVFDRDGNLKLDNKKIGKLLDSDYLRFTGNETQIVLGDQIYSIIDTAMSGTQANPEVELSLRNVDTGASYTQKLSMNDKVDVPSYDYFVRPGISRAGSNLGAASNILDGDLTTYWEPDLADTIDSWWVEVDLGRAVVVEKIVLRFVIEGMGDPFRQFRVLAAPDQETIENADSDIDFSLAGRTNAPNTDQRTFVLTPEEEPNFAQPRSDPVWTGRMVETIRILVTDSKRFRARQISRENWEALSLQERGDIVYYIRDEAGFEEPVDSSIYESFGSERQGRKEYYIRERPRLSEVEVWGWGDNLAPGVLGTGSGVDLTGPYKADAGFDGDWNSNFTFLTWYPTLDRGVMIVDLGALLWLDAMRISASGGLIDGYIVQVSDGARDARGELSWRTISPRSREENRIDQFMHFADFYDPPLLIRYLNARIVTNTPGGPRRRPFNSEPRIAELQYFSQGYVAEATMTSDIIRMPGPRNLGAIRWNPEDQPEGTSVEIRTRTGDLLVEQIRYFDSAGKEKTKKEWEELFSKYRGPVDTTFTPGGGWSSWSRKYLRSGDRVTSPGLRNFMELQVKFTSNSRWQAASIRSLEVELLDPVAHSLVGEVWPQEAIPGKPDTFEVYLHPTFIDTPSAVLSAGFDEVLLSAPAGSGLRLLSASIGTEEEFRKGAEHPTFERIAEEREFLSASSDTLHVFRDGGDSVWVRFPSLVQSVPEALVPKVYNRVTPAGDEVPVGHDGDPLTEAAYGLLSETERGRILFFKKIIDREGNLILEEVEDRVAYEELAPEEQGPIRYFRKLIGAGAHYPFDARGDSLTFETYIFLDPSERGIVIGSGRLIRLCFTSTVFLNGTTLKAFVRNTGPTSDPGELLWQPVDPGDATSLTPGKDLSITVPVGGEVIDELAIFPNPFTPNGDGVNDVLEVGFSVFRVTTAREARMRIYTLAGRLLWEEGRMAHGGRHRFRWTGVNRNGRTVPPGLYICQVHVEADWKQAKGMTKTRVIAVAY